MGLIVEIPEMSVRGVVKREDLPPSTNWRFVDFAVAGAPTTEGIKLPAKGRPASSPKQKFPKAKPNSSNSFKSKGAKKSNSRSPRKKK